ncbi:tetratricopeptide repeat protein [Flavobacterium silvaticum]|uniref:Tetratricopeptide repeat protein n=1 Tax=Flavobacterium silvaticum TaxID=1852020 RepID=A0A972FJZ8_9FLAO|nr:hypothetical protein [Flavobacterium silvaticum]NMH27168.1 hypothetical protein [Flavobacterium silvaticum]
MKKQFSLLLLMLLTGAIYAQKSVDPCQKKVVALDSIFRLSEYETALSLFDDLRKNCNSQRESFQYQGVDLLKYRISTQKEPAAREKSIRDLLAYYDEYAKVVPSKAKSVGVKKAMVLSDYEIGTPDEIYAMLDKSFITDRDSFDDPKAIMQYFKLYYDKFKKGDKDITVVSLFSKQDDIDQLIASKISKLNDKEARPFNQVSKSIGNLVKKEADCKSLSSYYNTSFEQKKTDTLWLQVASERLLASSCTADPVFLSIAQQSFKLKPTSKTAFGLGIAYQRQGKIDESARYFEQSAELESKPLEKANRYFILASSIYRNRDNAKAKASALKALQFDPAMGKAWLLLAQMYASGSKGCTNSGFEKRALNLLASETALKAGVANPKMKNTAEDASKKYLADAPTSQEIKEAGMAGKTITFGCWINEKVNIPK